MEGASITSGPRPRPVSQARLKEIENRTSDTFARNPAMSRLLLECWVKQVDRANIERNAFAEREINDVEGVKATAVRTSKLNAL